MVHSRLDASRTPVGLLLAIFISKPTVLLIEHPTPSSTAPHLTLVGLLLAILGYRSMSFFGELSALYEEEEGIWGEDDDEDEGRESTEL
jgi:hypothetical protein